MHIDSPTLGPDINGLVGLLSAHALYSAAVRYTRQQDLPLPPQPDAVKLIQAEQVLAAVQQGFAQYGDEREQVALECFADEPEQYEEMLIKLLRTIAVREQAFAQQLHDLAQQTNTRSGLHYAGIV